MNLSQLIALRSLTPAERRLAEIACRGAIGHPDRNALIEIANEGIRHTFGEHPFTDTDLDITMPILKLMDAFEGRGRRDAKYEAFIVSLERLALVTGLDLLGLPCAAAFSAKGRTPEYLQCRNVLGLIALAWQATREEEILTTREDLAERYQDLSLTSHDD